jgi:hypothetical protein
MRFMKVKSDHIRLVKVVIVLKYSPSVALSLL